MLLYCCRLSSSPCLTLVHEQSWYGDHENLGRRSLIKENAGACILFIGSSLSQHLSYRMSPRRDPKGSRSNNHSPPRKCIGNSHEQAENKTRVRVLPSQPWAPPFISDACRSHSHSGAMELWSYVRGCHNLCGHALALLSAGRQRPGRRCSETSGTPRRATRATRPTDRRVRRRRVSVIARRSALARL